MKYLTSAQNDTLKSLVRLASRPAERRKAGLLVLEGLHLVDAYLRAGHTLDSLYLREDALAQAKEVHAVGVLAGGAVLQALAGLSLLLLL